MRKSSHAVMERVSGLSRVATAGMIVQMEVMKSDVTTVNCTKI